MVTACSNGQMDVSMKASGWMGNSTEKASTQLHKVSLKQACGQMVKEHIGFQIYEFLEFKNSINSELGSFQMKIHLNIRINIFYT